MSTIVSTSQGYLKYARFQNLKIERRYNRLLNLKYFITNSNLKIMNLKKNIVGLRRPQR